MINKPKGYDEAQPYTEVEKLPPGGYVVKIMNAKVQTYHWGNVLVIAFDIIEGEQTGFYKRNYDAQTQEDKKWKGTFRINLPKDDGTEQDGWTLRSMKTNMNAIEDSNEGYAWNWDETSLKDKIVGALFRNREYDFQGRHGFYTECCKFMAVEKIRDGEFRIPDDKLLGNSKADSSTPEGFTEITDDDIPF